MASPRRPKDLPSRWAASSLTKRAAAAATKCLPQRARKFRCSIDLMNNVSTPRVQAGALIALRLYDVAYSIDLDKVERLGGAQSPGGAARIKLARAEPKAIEYGVPPVEIRLGNVALQMPLGIGNADATARVYEFGAMSIALRVSVSDIAWPDYVDASVTFDRSAMHGEAAQQFTELADSVCALIRPAMDRPATHRLEEDYFLSIVQSLDPPLTGDELMQRLDLAPLLSGEAGELSEATRRDVLRNNYSYLKNDLVVIAWDNAFLLEPSGDLDV